MSTTTLLVQVTSVASVLTILVSLYSVVHIYNDINNYFDDVVNDMEQFKVSLLSFVSSYL